MISGNYKAGEEDNDVDIKKDLYKATVWKVMVDYCQIVGLMSFMKFPKPPAVKNYSPFLKILV
jgi:hypothetical protein